MPRQSRSAAPLRFTGRRFFNRGAGDGGSGPASLRGAALVERTKRPRAL